MTAYTRTRIASHRGGTLEYGDSTPQGFRATAALAVEEVEFDVHPTSDGAIIVHHDATIDRTTDRVGAICEMTEAEVRSATINYSRGEHPLSLAALCEIYQGSSVSFRCEIKPGPGGVPYLDFVPRVVKELDRWGMLGRTGFSSFCIATMEELLEASGRPCLWLVSPPVQTQLGVGTVIELARSRGISEIGIMIDLADRGVMAEVRRAGLDFGCWGAHSQSQIQHALEMGVKVFTTDRPNLAVARRATFELEREK